MKAQSGFTQTKYYVLTKTLIHELLELAPWLSKNEMQVEVERLARIYQNAAPAKAFITLATKLMLNKSPSSTKSGAYAEVLFTYCTELPKASDAQLWTRLHREYKQNPRPLPLQAYDTIETQHNGELDIARAFYSMRRRIQTAPTSWNMNTVHSSAA